MAQRRGQDQSTQDEDTIEYAEMDPVPPTTESNTGIYFSPNDTNGQDPPTSRPVTRQASEGTYDLPGSSAVYRMPRRDTDNQNERAGKIETNAAWTMATKLVVSLISLILVVLISGVGIALFVVFNGKLHF